MHKHTENGYIHNPVPIPEHFILSVYEMPFKEVFCNNSIFIKTRVLVASFTHFHFKRFSFATATTPRTTTAPSAIPILATLSFLLFMHS